MGVVAECKQESGNEETSSSAVDTGPNAPLTVTTQNKIPNAGQDGAYQQKPSSMDTETSTISDRRPDDVELSTLQPANKRIKLENEQTTITAGSNDASVAVCVTHKGIGNSSNCVAKAPIVTTAPAPITDPSSGLTNPVATASAGCDSVATSTTATLETSSKTRPQHSITPAVATGQLQQSEGISSITPSTCLNGSEKVTQSVPVKVEASSASSSNSHGGSSSVVTASIGSSPQHTTADSSNESLNDAESNPSAAASAPATSSASTGAVQPVTTGTAVPAAPPPISKPPLSHAPTATTPLPTAAAPTTNAPTVTATQKHQPLATTKPGSTTTPSASKPAPVRTHIPPSSVKPTTAVPVSKTSTNTITVNNEVPLKSLNFGHLRIKYLGELEYMLREFRKLERQLLGAKGAQQLEESVGSRERREKLHSFILHLEDTIRQIEIGCKLETDGNAGAGAQTGTSSGSASASASNNPAGDATSSTIDAAAEEAKKQLAQESALSNLTKEKEEEETVQKLEEHILANLLPVKVRLKKQLAAQQGATQNPPGMPAMRRGTLQPSSTTRGKGTFVEAVEKKRKHAESLRLAAQAQHERQARSVSDPTQFGKPLSGIGSSLTKKLHGSTLGSKNRRSGHGVGSSSGSKESQERKILHAGMVPKSTQQKSGLSAASGAHEIVTSQSQNDSATNQNPATAALAASMNAKSNPAQTVQASAKTSSIAGKPKRTIVSKGEAKTSAAATTIVSDAAKQNKSAVASSSAPLSEEDKLKFKKHRRLRKLKRLKRRRERELARQQLPKSQQLSNNSQSSSNAAVGRKKAGHAKVGQKKKGPRVVEYICSQCSEAYSSTCDFNPWWALAQHKCPKCQKTQIPRIDITSPANAIEYHPALLSHLEDGGRGGGSSLPTPVAPAIPIVSQIPDGANSINSESDSDLSELSDDNISIGSLKAAELESELQAMTPAERAEHETFGKEYEGPVLSEDHAAKLLILMGHASTCPCQHKSEKHRDVCRSTKYMMLHVRDCPGTTSTCDVCPFPWCRKVKHLLYHLVSCKDPDQCAICSPKDLPKGLQGLVGLNAHRNKKHRERLIAMVKAKMTAKSTKPNQATKKQTTTRKTASTTQANTTLKVVPDTKSSAVQQNATVQRPASTQAPAPVKPKVKTVPAPAPAPYISSTTIVASVDTGVSNSNHVSNPLVPEAHATMAQLQSTQVTDASTTNDLDFDINAEIAKLDELAADHPVTGLNDTCTIVPVKPEVDTSIPIPIANVKVEPSAVAGPPPNYSAISTSEATNDDQVLPTPVAAIEMDVLDAEDADMVEILASNSSSEEHEIGNPMAEGDVGDVSEYLKNEYQIPPQHAPQDSVRVTEHQQQIDINSGEPGVDISSDPLANINHEMFIESTDVSHTALVADPAPAITCVGLKQEYSEAVSATSVQPTPDVSTVTTASTDVEKAVGSVTVN